MNFQKPFLKAIVVCSLFLGVNASVAFGQDDDMPMRVGVPNSRPIPVAVGNNLHCAGYIQSSAISTENKIVGSKDESDKYNYSQNDFMYINMGRNKGVNVGDQFAVVRPRAAVKSKWTNKSDIGFYVQEVGTLQVVSVKDEVSVARVKFSCDSFLLGDLVQLKNDRKSPMYTPRPALDLFADPTGKASGRILMARDLTEALSANFVVYVDLGADNNVQVGDYMTIYRPLHKGNLMTGPGREVTSARDYGFESYEYKGGKFSNQSGRKKGEKADGQEVTTNMAKEDRPKNLRKIVGEAVVLNVKEKTATVLITRNAQEIHTGDFVELQ